MDCRLPFIKDREGGGRTEGGVSEREEETDVETDGQTDTGRQTDRKEVFWIVGYPLSRRERKGEDRGGSE